MCFDDDDERDFDVELFKIVIKETVELFGALYKRDNEKLEWKYIDLIRNIARFSETQVAPSCLEHIACVKIAEFLLDHLTAFTNSPEAMDYKEWPADNATIVGGYLNHRDSERNYSYNVNDGELTDMLEFAELIQDYMKWG